MKLLLLAALLLPDDCRSTSLEASPTPLEEVFEVRLAERTAALWDPAWGRTYATVYRTEEGETGARVYAERAEDRDIAGVRDLLVAALRRAPSVGEPWRLAIAEGGEAGVRLVSGFTVCEPVIRDRADVDAAVRRARSGFAIPQTVTLVVRAKVTPEGRVEEVAIDRSTGDFDLDVALAGVVWGLDFEPARLEGIPVDAWARFPITIKGTSAQGPD